MSHAGIFNWLLGFEASVCEALESYGDWALESDFGSVVQHGASLRTQRSLISIQPGPRRRRGRAAGRFVRSPGC